MTEDKEAGDDTSSVENGADEVSVEATEEVPRAAESSSLVPQVTQATLSQALGTIIYPITREIAQWEERGINGLKMYLRAKRQQKLADASAVELRVIRSQVESDGSSTTVVERLLRAFEDAADQDMDDESLLALWRSLIVRIKEGDHDTELLQNKLKEISPGEAHLLLEIGHGKRIRYGLHPLLAAVSPGGRGMYYSRQREQQIARSLRKKDLIEQALPLHRVMALVAGFIPMMFLVLYPGNGLGDVFGPLVWPGLAIALLIGTFLALTTFPPPVRPTWIGAKLLEGVLAADEPGAT